MHREATQKTPAGESEYDTSFHWPKQKVRLRVYGAAATLSTFATCHTLAVC